MTQREQILEILRDRRDGVCVADLPVELGYTARNRIGELRNSGHAIEGERCTVHRHRSAVMRYRLAPAEQGTLL